jgi:NADH-quinone oxidoreductase subunit E
VLSAQSQREIDAWLRKFPADQRQSAVLAALHIVQDENGGFLTEDLLDAVADYLGMPRIAVYEAATFYNMYDLQPVGRHKILLCTNISCMLRGSEQIEEHLKKKLGIKFGETSADGKFTLKEVECLAACKGAPMMMVDKIYYEDLTVEKVDQILDGLE